MKKRIFKLTIGLALTLLASGFFGTAWGGCIPSNVSPEEADGLVTEFDGNMSCGNISGQFGCEIPGGSTAGLGLPPNEDIFKCTDPADSTKFFNVFSERPDGEPASWRVEVDVDGNGVGIDSVITDSAQGGNGCLYAFESDAKSGVAGFLKSNNVDVVLRNLTLCADGEDEPVPPPTPTPAAKIAACVFEADGSTNIAGVEIGCPAGPWPFNQRTIIVASHTDGGGFAIPNKGFRNDAGEIDFGMFLCVCNGPELGGEEEQCNPNLESILDDPDETGEFAGLFACVVAAQTDSSESIDFTNPTCVTSGGRRRCY